MTTSAAASAPLRIALADDQALVREGLAALLGRLGLEVVASVDEGRALLEVLAATAVDVIVSDVRMPGLDGVALVRELRTRGLATPVVLVTTFEEDDLVLAAAEAGASKPPNERTTARSAATKPTSRAAGMAPSPVAEPARCPMTAATTAPSPVRT